MPFLRNMAAIVWQTGSGPLHSCTSSCL